MCNSREFCFWMQGFFETTKPKTIGEKETKVIKEKLSAVFKHDIDPSMGDEEHQEVLNHIHSGPGLNQDPDGPTIYRC